MIKKFQQFTFSLLFIFVQNASALDAEDSHYQESHSPDEASSLPAVSEDDYIGDVPKVLTVSRLAQSVADTPAAVTVIDRETIRASGALDIPELFRLVPGMYVGANAGYVYSTNHTVSYHGMTNAYAGTMQVMINGRSVYNSLFGGVKWSELPLAMVDIERIEVTRGPNAASHGANSFFGVINIITKSGADLPANSVIASHGSGRNELFYRHAGVADSLNYRVTAGYRQDDGLDDRNDFKRTRLLNAALEYRVNPTNNVAFEFGAAEAARGEGDINEDNQVFLPRTKQVNNYYGLVRWNHQWSDTSDIQLQAYYSCDSSDDPVTSANLRPVVNDLLVASAVKQDVIAADVTKTGAQRRAARRAAASLRAAASGLGSYYLNINNDVEMERSDIELQQTFSVGSDIRAVWGGSVRRDSLYAPFFLNTKKTDNFDLQRLFAHVEWSPHPMWTVNTGAMVEHNDFTGTDNSPRASLHFKPTSNQAIRLGISSALRTPNYVEEKFKSRYFLPTRLSAPFPSALLLQINDNNGDLKPEQIISREIGYWGKWDKLSVDVRVFNDRISNLIRNGTGEKIAAPADVLVLNRRGEIERKANRGAATVEGFELQTQWKLNENTQLLLNHSHINVRALADGLKQSFAESAPSNTLTAMLTHQFTSNWDASIAYYQTSQTTQLGDGDPVDLIRQCNVRVARKFNAGRWSGEVSGVVENLFDSHYQEFADYNTLKRRAHINLRLDF